MKLFSDNQAFRFEIQDLLLSFCILLITAFKHTELNWIRAKRLNKKTDFNNECIFGYWGIKIICAIVSDECKTNKCVYRTEKISLKPI